MTTPDQLLAQMTPQIAAKVQAETDRATAIAVKQIQLAAAGARAAAVEEAQKYVLGAGLIGGLLGGIIGFLLAVRHMKKKGASR